MAEQDMNPRRICPFLSRKACGNVAVIRLPRPKGGSTMTVLKSGCSPAFRRLAIFAVLMAMTTAACSSDSPADQGGATPDANASTEDSSAATPADSSTPAGTSDGAASDATPADTTETDNGAADSGEEDKGTSPADATPGDNTSGDSGPEDTAPADPDAGPEPAFPVPDDVSCASPVPEGAPKPPPFKPYSGTCPVFKNNFADPKWNPAGGYDKQGLWEIEPAGNINTILSAGNNRQFYLVYPPDWDGKTPLPVVWGWHWLAAKAKSFLRDAEIMWAVKTHRFIAVIPEALKKANGDRLYTANTWPFPPAVTTSKPADPGGQTGPEADIKFFDDTLYCLSQQFAVNNQCVSTVGVSAGALWSAYLATQRGEYLASVLSLSGGYSDTFPKWQPQTHKYHTLVLWGGCTDRCILDMTKMSMRYQEALVKDGHFTVECVHPCQHGVPPVPRLDNDQNMPKFELLWSFILNHPYWVPPNRSPFRKGLPKAFPTGPHTTIGTCGPKPSQCSGDTDADYTKATPLCKVARTVETDCSGTWK
ncbi:MAG: hypothetical protein GMKNLPBB_02784 [Myxococcota bacterium]|nr:hypothetical protein [Myxococcota bacterium]